MLRKKSTLLRFFITFVILVTGLPFAASAQTAPAVLAELFRNIDCLNCQTPDNAFESFVQSHPGIVVINYNNDTPDPNDPFYIASLPASKDRNEFYGGSTGLSDPTAYIDGIFAGSGSNTEPQWEADANAGLAHPLNPQSPIVAFGPNGIDTISFTLTPHKLVVAYVAIVESKIFYDNGNHSYGNPPDSLWNNVFRTMLLGPNDSGQVMGLRNFKVVFDPSQYPFTGDPANMSAVIFTQDAAAASAGNNSHQAEALGVVSLAPPSAVAEKGSSEDRLIIPQNPLSPRGEFRFELAAPGRVQISLFDMLGREIRTLVEGTMPSGQTTVELNETSLLPGAYIARMTVDGITVDQKKFVMQ